MQMPVPEGTAMSTTSIRATDVSQRFAGMIELSTYKKMRNSLFQLFDYISQTAPPMFGLHSIISVWRIVQYFGSSFVPRYYSFWTQGTAMDKLSDILSIASHLLPGSAREAGDVPFLYAYVGVFAVFYVCLGIATVYFSKNAKLPKAATVLLNVFVGTVGYLAHPIAVAFASETIGRCIDNPAQWLTFVNILAVILTYMVLGFYLWLYANVYSVTIIFKPDSLQVTIPSVQVGVISATLVINFLIGIAGELSKWPRLIITGLTGVFCFGAILILFQKGGLVSRGYEKALGASSCAEGILFFVVICYEVMNQTADEIVIFIVAGVWLISFGLFHVYFEKRAGKHIAMLDMVEDSPDNFEYIHSETQLAGMAVTGFRFAHPVCLSWQLFKLAIERWPTNVDIWVLFAKLTAIYPEETQQLNWIAMGMQQNRLRGALAKHTQQQIGSIMKQRETNLIPDLKRRLDKVGKQVQATKHKVRYIWDLIIQGNIKELETVIDRAYTAIDTCDAEFLHLLRQFPNSRFVARAYARFLRDVVADHAGHKQWAQNVTNLQRGVSVVADQAHVLGLKAFPLLPKNVDTHMAIQQTQGMVTDDTLTQDIEADDEQAAIDAELRVSVRDSINKLVIPSFKMTKCIRIWMILLFFLVPVVAVTIYFPIYIETMTEPLTILYSLSDLRTLLLQLVGVGFHFVCERCNIINIPDSGDAPPETFGSTHNSSLQVLYLAQQVTDMIPQLSVITEYAYGDPTMDIVRKYVFQNIVSFKYIYDVTKEAEAAQISLQRVFVEFVVLLRELVQLSDLEDPNNYNDGFPTETIFTQKYVSIPFNNIQPVTENVSTAINYVNQYVQESYESLKWITLIIRIAIMVTIPVFYLFMTIYIARRIAAEKMMIYKCLASLPKNVVSRVADSFKVLKKEEDEEMKTSHTRDEELNKQEENVLKIFATSSDGSGTKAADTSVLIVTTVFLMICFLVTCALVIQFIDDSMKQVADSAPHIDYIMGSYTYDFSSVIVMIMLGASFSGYNVYQFPHDEMVEVIHKWQDRGIQAYRKARFGEQSDDVNPFYGFSQGLDKQDPLPGCDVRTIPESNHDVYRCWGADLLTSYLQMHLLSLLNMHLHYYTADRSLDLEWDRTNFSLFDRKFDDMWHIHLVHLYNRYFYPMFKKIIPHVDTAIQSELSSVLTVSWVMFVIGAIVETVLVLTMINSEARQKFALRLLLQCPGDVVVANSHITALLSGNFSESHMDATNRDSEFYDVIVQDMPDAIFTTDLDGKIITANKATKRIFDLDPTTLVGTPISQMGSKFKDENPFDCLIKGQINESTNMEKVVCYVKENGDEIQCEISLSVVQENVIITTRDVTQTVMYNRLIADERAKSDQLLSSILPARLVARVQAGEKNISFSVQSASIVFMDIVSFTPWCGSLPAATVMKTLNLLFKEDDALVAAHPTMTKIKCIGDCYMAAGGIFMDINQPAVHAKDVVEFGLDAIAALERLNKEIDQTLQIRVGINTGGPIVAGVLGTAKPTFEIIGPAINMAQQMEHHGVAMKVHVSRAVYELIYGGSFSVKERGEVQLKNGPAVTYLIDKRASSEDAK